MANAGPVPIQGCALRTSRLNADGSVPGTSATGMVVNDKPFLKFSAKPNTEAGVEVVLKNACGGLLAAYKDFDRIKRWDVTIDFGDYDFDRMEMLGGGRLITAATSGGRAVADGVTTLNSTHITSATAAFVQSDVGRSVVGTGIPATTFIILVVSSTEAVMNNAATITGSGVSLTFGALASRTIGYQWPSLLAVANPNGVAIEIWQKAIVAGTGFPGTVGYPQAGRVSGPALNPSGWIRFGAFRCFLNHADIGVEDKETPNMYTGWAIENPNFGTGPVKDWTETALVGGPAVDTTRVFNAMMDFQLPTPLQPGYQTTT